MNQNLIQSARKLRLSGLLLSLEMRLQEAASHQLSPEQFLELVLQDELNVRAHRRVERRKKAAAFRERRIDVSQYAREQVDQPALISLQFLLSRRRQRYKFVDLHLVQCVRPLIGRQQRRHQAA